MAVSQVVMELMTHGYYKMLHVYQLVSFFTMMVKFSPHHGEEWCKNCSDCSGFGHYTFYATKQYS